MKRLDRDQRAFGKSIYERIVTCFDIWMICDAEVIIRCEVDVGVAFCFDFSASCTTWGKGDTEELLRKLLTFQQAAALICARPLSGVVQGGLQPIEKIIDVETTPWHS